MPSSGACPPRSCGCVRCRSGCAGPSRSSPSSRAGLRRGELLVDAGGALGDIRPVEAADVLEAVGDEAAAEVVVGEDANSDIGQRGGIARAEAKAGLLVRDYLAQATGVG